jgi:hypothetical protein
VQNPLLFVTETQTRDRIFRTFDGSHFPQNTRMTPSILFSLTFRIDLNSRKLENYFDLKNAVLWDVAPCRSCKMNRRFGGTYRLHLQSRKIREPGASVSRWLQTLQAIRSAETSVQFTRSTQRHIPEDGTLHSHRRENVKSYILT